MKFPISQFLFFLANIHSFYACSTLMTSSKIANPLETRRLIFQALSRCEVRKG